MLGVNNVEERILYNSCFIFLSTSLESVFVRVYLGFLFIFNVLSHWLFVSFLQVHVDRGEELRVQMRVATVETLEELKSATSDGSVKLSAKRWVAVLMVFARL